MIPSVRHVREKVIRDAGSLAPGGATLDKGFG
jgi:hypothetical protein